MLSEAKHLWVFFNGARAGKSLSLKAWPRGLRPLRCSFASLRMTERLSPSPAAAENPAEQAASDLPAKLAACSAHRAFGH